MNDTQNEDAFAVKTIKNDMSSRRKHPKSSTHAIMCRAHLRICVEKIEDAKNRVTPSSGSGRIA